MGIRAVYRRLVPRVIRQPIWQIRRLGVPRAIRVATRVVRTRWGARIAEVRLPHGRLAVDLTDEGVGQRIYDVRAYEPNETALLRSVLGPGMTFADVGANIGYFSLLASKLVGDSGRVVAFEPDPENFRLLERNLDGNGCRHATPLRTALGGEPGSATLQRSTSNHGDHRLYQSDGPPRTDQVTVAVETFDRVMSQLGVGRVDVVKMDVQGYEPHVLRGMTRFLTQPGPSTLLTEYWPHGMRAAGGDPSSFLELLARNGFRARILTRHGELVPVAGSDIDSFLPQLDPEDPGGCYVNVVFSKSGPGA